MPNNNSLSGTGALQYRGTNAGNPPNVVYVERAPTINDYKNFVLGDLWVNKTTSSIYALVNLAINPSTSRQEATWTQLNGGGAALTFQTNMGTATPAANVINVVGGSNVLTSGSGNTVTVTATGGGGSGSVSIVGVGASISNTGSTVFVSPYGGTSATLESRAQLVVPDNGTLLYLSVNPILNTSTSDVDYTVRINGANTAMVVTIPAGSTSVVTNLVDTATVNQGDLMCLSIEQSTVGFVQAIVSWGFQGSGGGGGGSVNSVNAGTGITITGPATDPIVNLTVPVTVANGGTGATTLTGVLTGNGASPITASPVSQYGVVVGGASNAVTSVAPSATVGYPLISQGAASNPAFGVLPVEGGGTETTSFTAFAPVCGGTTSTSALQSAASGIANAGYVLTSTGAGSLPTWQPTSASTVTSLQANGGAVVSPTAGVINIANAGGLTITSGGGNNLNIAVANFVDKTAWTPVVSFGGTPVTSYTNREAYYARIGNIVFLWATVNINVKGAGVGNLLVTGFPVSCTHPVYSTVATEFISFANDAYCTMVFNTSTSIEIRASRNSTGLPLLTITDANIVSGSGFTITAWYFTT